MVQISFLTFSTDLKLILYDKGGCDESSGQSINKKIVADFFLFLLFLTFLLELHFTLYLVDFILNLTIAH